MELLITISFWASTIGLIYVYGVYYFCLRLLSFLRVRLRYQYNSYLPSISVMIAAHNEESVIKQRLDNLLALDYPVDKFEVIVVSDGSTDKTAEIASSYKHHGVKVLDFRINRGRAAIQNDGVRAATGEVIVFTDAETVFKSDFIKNVARYFADKSIGCVVGNLVYKTSKSSTSESEGLYWKFEKGLRQLESRIGILATASGACMAVKKDLWRDLTPIDDCDFTTPLDVVLQGYKVTYASDAIAYDFPPSSAKGELKTRIRQTSKNFIGTLKRWEWKGWIQHPFVSWGLLSHKILRWLTPFFMLGAFLSNLLLLDKGTFYQVIFAMQVLFYLAALLGLMGELVKKKLPIASTIFNFCVASTGMGIGVIKGLLGKAPVTYKTEN